VQLELGNPDLAMNRLRAIERGFRERFGEGGPYQYVLRYLNLVRDIIDDPAAATRPGFLTRVEQMADAVPLDSEREDLHAMSFYAWLKARALSRPYYDVLMELARAGKPEAQAPVQ
jgi:hypothetical protein